MSENIQQEKNRMPIKEIIRYAILTYWSLFWLLNSVDKIIGGSAFLWVGRDRFAQFHRFFDSIGIGSPTVTNAALILVAGLEIFAFVFFSGALYHFIRKNSKTSRSWFFVGISLTLVTFTLFTIGDHIFGDRFEILEHALFWVIALLSWLIFIRTEKIKGFDFVSVEKKQFLIATAITIVIIFTTTFSIFWHNQTSFIERTELVKAVQVGEKKYRISFPFLAGSKSFENSIENFKREYPSEQISHIYTVPKPLRLQKSDGLIIYIITNDKK